MFMKYNRVHFLFAASLLLVPTATGQTPGHSQSDSTQSKQSKESNRNPAGDATKDTPIAEIKFEGNRVFTSKELAGVLGRCLNGNEPAQLKYEEHKFEYCTGYNVTNHMRGRGYLRARIGKPEKQESIEGLKITLPVEEGVRYRLGEIKFEGLTLFPPEQVMEMLRQETGKVINGGEIFKGLQERLRKAYAERGYIQYDYDVEPIFGAVADGAGEGTADFIISIMEGPMFKVRRIEFVGNASTRDDVLRRELSVKEDETFNQKLFEESIERLNGLGLFEEIDWMRDADMRTDEESGLLDLIIKLKERKPQPMR